MIYDLDNKHDQERFKTKSNAYYKKGKKVELKLDYPGRPESIILKGSFCLSNESSFIGLFDFMNFG